MPTLVTNPPTPTSGLFLLPVRNRPHKLAGILARAFSARIVVLLDPDDVALPFHKESCHAYLTDYIIGPPNATTVRKLNNAFERFPNERFYGFLADDIILPTDHKWPEHLLAHLPPLGLVHPNDFGQGENFLTHPILDGDLVRLMLNIAPPAFAHNGINCVWGTVAQAFGGVNYVPSVVFKHNHPAFDRSIAVDNIHARAASYRHQDAAAYHEFFSSGGKEKLIKEMRARLDKAPADIA